MSDQMKLNLSKCLTTLTIVMALATIIGAAYIGYDNAKEAKNRTIALELQTVQRNREIDSRMTVLELDYAKFKGVMEERTRVTQENTNIILKIVREWQPENQSN
jgi:hypothetical protein